MMVSGTSPRSCHRDWSKPVVFRFQGGMLDGQDLRSDSPDLVEAFRAKGYFLLTREGSIGRDFYTSPEPADGLSDAGAPSRLDDYVVTERAETDDDVTVRMRFVGVCVLPENCPHDWR